MVRTKDKQVLPRALSATSCPPYVTIRCLIKLGSEGRSRIVLSLRALKNKLRLKFVIRSLYFPFILKNYCCMGKLRWPNGRRRKAVLRKLQHFFAYPSDDLRAAPSRVCLSLRKQVFFLFFANARGHGGRVLLLLYLFCVKRAGSHYQPTRQRDLRRKFSCLLCRLCRCVLPARHTGARNPVQTVIPASDDTPTNFRIPHPAHCSPINTCMYPA